MEVRLAGLVPNSNANGLGLRDVIFAQGCSHGCKECFNKHTWDPKGGKACDCDEIIAQCVDRSYLAGVTFSGGDPLEQPQAFAYIAQGLKKHNINIWCYTGYTWEELMELAKTNQYIMDLLKNIDTLVDGPYISSLHDENIEWRGSSNQRIIDVVQSLKQHKVVIDNRFK